MATEKEVIMSTHILVENMVKTTTSLKINNTKRGFGKTSRLKWNSSAVGNKKPPLMKEKNYIVINLA